MEAAVLTREQTLKKDKKKAIILLSQGMIPKDYPKEKAFEFLSLKLSLDFKGFTDLGKLKILSEEIKNWPRNELNDPLYYSLKVLAEELYYALGFNVEIAFEDLCNPSFKDVIDSLIKKGFYYIIVVPVNYLLEPSEEINKIIKEQSIKHEVEIILAWPYKQGLKADFLASHVLNYVRKNL